jgi:DNA mismatch endonuclease (patch repair protein)
VSTRRPAASSSEALRRLQQQRQRDTAPEIAIRSRLHSRGHRFRVDYPVLGRRRADIAFPRRRVAVFVDGCFWHGCPVHGTSPKANREWWAAKIASNRERDRDTDERLTELGWTVVRVWEHLDPEQAVNEVERFLADAKSDPPRRRRSEVPCAGS